MITSLHVYHIWQQISRECITIWKDTILLLSLVKGKVSIKGNQIQQVAILPVYLASYNLKQQQQQQHIITKQSMHKHIISLHKNLHT